ncbi:MAG: hypothetical protein K2W82_16905 [Candidatus Obscuribacterales bacterium]|nr:hypothetical protein [Candidatus Obscuribacterales bacterium]
MSILTDNHKLLLEYAALLPFVPVSKGRLKDLSEAFTTLLQHWEMCKDLLQNAKQRKGEIPDAKPRPGVLHQRELRVKRHLAASIAQLWLAESWTLVNAARKELRGSIAAIKQVLEMAKDDEDLGLYPGRTEIERVVAQSNCLSAQNLCTMVDTWHQQEMERSSQLCFIAPPIAASTPVN